VHAISGCDTTSALYGLGKGRAWQRLIGNQDAYEACQILTRSDVLHDDIMSPGLKLMALLYGGKSTVSLNHMRYVMFMNCAATGSIQPRAERLPPTKNAARYHLYRVHLQVVQWKTLMSTSLKAEDWGWKLN